MAAERAGPHVIEAFTAGCPLCRSTLGMLEIGKCATCVLIERDLTRQDATIRRLVEEYGIRAAPTIVIDGLGYLVRIICA